MKTTVSGLVNVKKKGGGWGREVGEKKLANAQRPGMGWRSEREGVVLEMGW